MERGLAPTIAARLSTAVYDRARADYSSAPKQVSRTGSPYTKRAAYRAADPAVAGGLCGTAFGRPLSGRPTPGGGGVGGLFGDAGGVLPVTHGGHCGSGSPDFAG